MSQSAGSNERAQSASTAGGADQADGARAAIPDDARCDADIAAEKSAARAARDGEADWVTVRNTGPGFRTDAMVRGHQLLIDEPADVGGTNAGPTPYDYLLTAVGACTAMTVRMYATRKQWPLEEVVVRVRHGRSHEVDCEACEHARVGIEQIERAIELIGPLTDDQRTRILAIADRCPVKQTLQAGIRVV